MKIKKCLTLFLALALVLGSTGGWSARAEEAEDSALAPTLSETAGTAAAAPATLETQPAGEPAFLSHMDGEQFAQADHVARLAGEERLDTYVYLNRDGTKSVYYMGRNVKFVDTDGTVKEKDTTLVSADGGYTMRQNNVNLLLPHNPADGVLLAAGGGGVRLVPQGGSGSAVLEDNAVLYEDYYGLGMSLKYTPMLDGVKEDIILESYSGVSSFSFGLATNGLRLYERNGRWCLAQNATAEAAFRLGEILVYDAVGKPAAGTLTVQEVRTGVYTLTVSAPVAYLTDPTTVYPVTIDPTITSKDTMSTSNIEDATVFSGYPNNNFGNYVFNTIGYQDASYGTGRVAVRLKGLLNDETYQSLSADHIASVQFYMKDGGSNYAYVNIHALTGNSTWTESTVKNSNVGTASETVYDSQRMGGSKWATFDLTDLVKDWKNGDQNGQCGFLMVIADSTKKIGALSCEYGSGDYWPYVVVNYAVSSVLNYTVKDINEGSSFALTADTGGVAAEITWTSSNTGVATVSSSGVVTGVNAGKAVITASSDVFTEPVSCTVYVTVPDGVYYIKNASSGLCLQGAVSSVGIYEQKTGSENRLNQLWKIHYLGSGYYVIRPMMDFAAALTTNNQGYAAVAAAAVEDDEIATGSRWTIIHNSFGYAFKRSESDTTVLTPVVSGCPGSAVYLGTWDASLTRHWELESAKGIFLRDTTTLKLLTSTSTRYILLGESATLSELGIRHECAGSITNLTWSFGGTSVATGQTNTGKVTGNRCGVTTVTATVAINGTTYSQSYKLCVMLIPEGTYFIRSKSSGKYADIKDQAMADGTTIHQWDFHGGNTQRWIFTYQPDGTYTIHSANSATKYYLGVSGDSAANNQPVVLRTSGAGSGAKWKISRTTSGAYKLTPLTGEANNRVLALDVGVLGNATANGDTLQQRDYVDDTNYKDEWFLQPMSVSLGTPLFKQTTGSWCWAASAQMLARTLWPSTANNGDLRAMQKEQRAAVYHVFGASGTTEETYDWENDLDEEEGQGLTRKGGIYTDVGNAAAFLTNQVGGDTVYVASLSRYSEEYILQFLIDGYPIARLYYWIDYNGTEELSGEEILNILQNDADVVRHNGHVVVITGATWSEEYNCYLYTVKDPGYSVTSMSYSELKFSVRETINGTQVSFWYPTVTVKTPYSNATELLGVDVVEYPSLEEE